MYNTYIARLKSSIAGVALIVIIPGRGRGKLWAPQHPHCHQLLDHQCILVSSLIHWYHNFNWLHPQFWAPIVRPIVLMTNHLHILHHFCMSSSVIVSTNYFIIIINISIFTPIPHVDQLTLLKFSDMSIIMKLSIFPSSPLPVFGFHLQNTKYKIQNIK